MTVKPKNINSHNLNSLRKTRSWAEKLLTDINFPPIIPDEDNNFGGSLGLDLRKWWRHVQPENRLDDCFLIKRVFLEGSLGSLCPLLKKRLIIRISLQSSSNWERKGKLCPTIIGCYYWNTIRNLYLVSQLKNYCKKHFTSFFFIIFTNTFKLSTFYYYYYYYCNYYYYYYYYYLQYYLQKYTIHNITYTTRTTYNPVLYYVFFPFYTHTSNTHRTREKWEKKKKRKKKNEKEGKKNYLLHLFFRLLKILHIAIK